MSCAYYVLADLMTKLVKRLEAKFFSQFHDRSHLQDLAVKITFKIQQVDLHSQHRFDTC